MSTRSNIIAKMRDGRYARIYCHFDGYPEGVGATLLEHYTDQDKIEALIQLGDLSVLGAEIAPPEGTPHSFDHPQHDVCLAYGRDRKEQHVAASYHSTQAAALAYGGGIEEYAYVWNGKRWGISTGGAPRRLTPAQCGVSA